MFGFKKKQTYLSSSEFVSSGHPDRLADNLAAIVINDIQKADGICSHAAIEVFITHDSVIFGGEATTSIALDYPYLRQVVSKGFHKSGYIGEMRKYWTKDEVVLASNMKIVNKICAQSPDIALGTTNKGEKSGWNDQGVYFSSSDNVADNHVGAPMFLAQTLGEALQEESKKTILNEIKFKGSRVVLGPDNKAVITCRVAEDGFTPIEITAVTIAVAHSSITNIDVVRDYVKSFAIETLKPYGIPFSSYCQWVINGTGRFVIHGPISDTSMTGRKISVNHPSAGPVWANKMIGGGSLVKPIHASDLILNLMARLIANVVVEGGYSSYAVVGLSGAIGQHGLQSLFIRGDEKFEKNKKRKDKIINHFMNNIEWTPDACAELLGFYADSFDFGDVVNLNFFGHPKVHPWEDSSELIDKEVRFLHTHV